MSKDEMAALIERLAEQVILMCDDIIDLNHRVLRLEMELSLNRELAAQSAGEGEKNE